MFDRPLQLPLLVGTFAAGVVGIGCGGDVGQPGPGTTSSSGSSGASDAGGADPDASTSGKKKVGEVGCTADDECQSNVCFKGNAQSFCTVRCTPNNATTMCTPPLTGTCNKQGYCKRD
jgi:hypothetical protein